VTFLLTEQLLPVMREISGELLIFQQDSAPAHRELVTQSAFWNWRHSLSFHQTCGFQQSRFDPVDCRIWGENAASALPDESSDIDDLKQFMVHLVRVRLHNGTKINDLCLRFSRKHVFWT